VEVAVGTWSGVEVAVEPGEAMGVDAGVVVNSGVDVAVRSDLGPGVVASVGSACSPLDSMPDVYKSNVE